MKDLKDRMMEDMKLRSLAPGTPKGYLDAITALAEQYHRPPDGSCRRASISCGPTSRIARVPPPGHGSTFGSCNCWPNTP